MPANLDKIIQKRDALKKDLKDIEQTILDLEYQYLSNTGHGNVVKGWEGFLNLNMKNASRNNKVLPKDQIFSQSSVSARSLFKLKKPTKDILSDVEYDINDADA